MKKLFLLLSLFVQFSLSAQLLFKISGNGLTEDSYILGTHHLTPISFTEQIAGFDEAFDTSKQFYGEIEMSPKALQALSSKIQSACLMPKDTLFKDLVTNEEYLYIDSQIKKYMGETVSLDKLSSLKPSTISIQLAAVVTMKTITDFTPSDAIDSKLQEVAVEKGKQIGALETAESQIKILFGDPLHDQAEALIRSLKSGDMVEQAKELTTIYQAQDAKTIYKKFEELMKEAAPDKKAFDKAMSKLLFDRNNNWMKQLPAIMQKGSTFIAVGAGHLYGKEGMIPLLKKNGYKVTPMK